LQQVVPPDVASASAYEFASQSEFCAAVSKGNLNSNLFEIFANFDTVA